MFINQKFLTYLKIKSFFSNLSFMVFFKLSKTKLKRECSLFFDFFSLFNFNNLDSNFIEAHSEKENGERVVFEETFNNFNYQSNFRIDGKFCYITVRNKKNIFYGFLSKILNGTFLYYFLFDINIIVVLSEENSIYGFNLVNLVNIIDIQYDKKMKQNEKYYKINNIFDKSSDDFEKIIVKLKEKIN